MKKNFVNGFCLVLTIVLVLMSALSTGAAVTDISDTRKTVLQYEDWMLEQIDQGTKWELDQYLGSDEIIYVPRFYNNLFIVALGDHSFMNNTTVKSVYTSSPLWTIGEYAFIDCTSLESIELNFAMETIGIGAFSGTSLLKNINLEDTIVTEIKPLTFLNSGIEEVKLPSTCTTLGDYSFGQCALLSKIEIPDSVTEIADTAFTGCDNLVIYGSTDSYAIAYAEAHGIDYVITDAPHYIVGDADNDGEVTIFDVTFIQRLLAKFTVDDADGVMLRGDVDSDGLTIFDATMIQRHIARFEVPDHVHIGRIVYITADESSY